MKVAVTGASGFIGRAVLGALSRRGITAVAHAHANLDAIAALGHQAVAMDLHAAPADAFDRLGRPDHRLVGTRLALALSSPPA